jgi:hypothetical protein
MMLCEMFIDNMSCFIIVSLDDDGDVYTVNIHNRKGPLESTEHTTENSAKDYAYAYIKSNYTKDTLIVARSKQHGTCRDISDYIFKGA